MLTRPSVERMAEAACAFAQKDDISILSITRVAAAVESRVSEPAII
jgi:hypothetical protein